jgi:hypothetical protein
MAATTDPGQAVHPDAVVVRVETLLGMLARDGEDRQAISVMRRLAMNPAVLGPVSTASEAQREFEVLWDTLKEARASAVGRDKDEQ